MSERLDRRTVLRAGAVATAGLLAGCSGGGAPTDSDGVSPATDTSREAESTASFDGYLSDVGNYDGVVDRTGESEVTVDVGVEANGGAYGFGPAAVKVDTGTTVVWEWTGAGQQHNVVAEDGSFESELTDEAGFTYERTVEETVKYYCTPHRALGMKGVVVVE